MKSRSGAGITAEDELTIGQVAARAGVAPSALRYYESLGLLPEPQRQGGQRRYDRTVLARLAVIGVAKQAGFRLSEIGELIEELDAGRSLADSMRALSIRRLAEVEAELERTAAVRDWLTVAGECECVSPDECSLFDDPDAPAAAETLAVVKVDGRSCRRVAESA